MTSRSGRDLLEQVVNEGVGGAAQVEWLEPGDGWSAHARLRASNGRVSHVLSSAEWQEARFEEPRCSVVILTTPDEEEVLEALEKLTRAVVEYSSGGGQVEYKRGLLGTRSVLVLTTNEGEWRIGRSSGTFPH